MQNLTFRKVPFVTLNGVPIEVGERPLIVTWAALPELLGPLVASSDWSEQNYGDDFMIADPISQSVDLWRLAKDGSADTSMSSEDLAGELGRALRCVMTETEVRQLCAYICGKGSV